MKKKLFVTFVLAALLAATIMPVNAREGNRNCRRLQAYCGFGCAVEFVGSDIDHDTLLAEREAYLYGLVAQRRITQARADAMLECFHAMLEAYAGGELWQCQRAGGCRRRNSGPF